MHFTLGNYKLIGLTYLLDDHILSIAGAAGHIFGLATRILFPTLLDYFSFKLVFSI